MTVDLAVRTWNRLVREAAIPPWVLARALPSGKATAVTLVIKREDGVVFFERQTMVPLAPSEPVDAAYDVYGEAWARLYAAFAYELPRVLIPSVSSEEWLRLYGRYVTAYETTKELVSAATRLVEMLRAGAAGDPVARAADALDSVLRRERAQDAE